MMQEPRLDDSAPWKQRFRATTVISTKIAAQTPDRGLAVTNPTGIHQLYAWHVPSGELRQLTDVRHGVLFGVISPDGRHIYYLEDLKGNERGHWVRVPFEGGAPEDITPELPPYSSLLLTINRQSDLIGFTMTSREGFVVYCLEIPAEGAFGPPRELYRSTGITFGPYLSCDGALAVMASSERSGGRFQFSLVAVDAVSGDVIAELWDGEGSSVEPLMFAPPAGDSRVLASTNRTGVKRPLIWDVHSEERTDLPVDGIEGEVIPLDWSPDGKLILLCQIHQAVHRLHVYDLEAGTVRRLEHPSGTLGWLIGVTAYFGPNGEIFAQWQNATHPLQTVAFDLHSGKLIGTVLPAGDVPPSRPWTSISFSSSDGQEIQGWLCVPAGEGPFPTILHTHGGPALVATETFMPECQAWVDHGFAFCSVNYRGSTTFGRDFQEQIHGDLGHWEVEDIVAARDWLVNHGIARPNQIFLEGRSYGGYNTLQTLGMRPDLWAGGMAGVPVADWALLYEHASDTLRGVTVAHFGGRPEDMPAQYARSSPMTYVERVSAPVMITHQRNDSRCPAPPVEDYERRMRALGKPIEVYWFDAGHLGSIANPEEAIQDQERMLSFAYRVLREPSTVR